MRRLVVPVLLCLVLGGCAVPYGASDGGGSYPRVPLENSVQAGANHLNTVVDPDLPHPAYPNCDLGDWNLKAGTSNSGNTFGGSSSQKCAGTAARRHGVNLYQPTIRGQQ